MLLKIIFYVSQKQQSFKELCQKNIIAQEKKSIR